MREGNSYHSENYKYLSNLFPRFLYVDRIAVQGNFRRKGLAQKIYSKVKENIIKDFKNVYYFDVKNLLEKELKLFSMKKLLILLVI